MPAVRLANSNDEDELVALLERTADQWGVRQTNGYSFPFSEGKARAAVRRAVHQDASWIGVVAGDEIEASICVFLNTPFFSETPFLAELWTVVHPDYRNSNNVKKLVDFAKSMAAASGLPVVLGVVAHDRVAAKQRLFDGLVGQPPSGNFYVYHAGAQ